MPVPGEKVIELSIASSKRWLVTQDAPTCCSLYLRLTTDGGETWTPFEVPNANLSALAGVAADGSFRFVTIRKLGQSDQELQVYRVGAVAPEPLGVPVIGTKVQPDGFVVADNGDTWVPHWNPTLNVFELTVVASDGSQITKTLPDSSSTVRWEARRSVFGMRTLRYISNPVSSNGVFGRQTYRLDGAGNVVPAETYPVSLAEGDLLVSKEFGTASWDGGADWSGASITTVPKLSEAEMPRYVVFDGGIIAERYSPSLFRGTETSWPTGAATNYLIDAGDAVIVGTDNVVYVHDTPLPPQPLEVGSLQPDTQRLLARADQFRADAGLPPLVGDATLSTASRNHSQYTVLHPKEVEQNAHDESPGLSGFTGIEPWDRCEAVGTTCNSEIMYPPVPDPVAGWLATIYHRPLIGSPEAGIVGGAEVAKGWAVMDSKGPQNLLVRPFGYPTGRWRGEEGFNGEIPDPVKACNESGQSISYPLGISVSLYLPTQEGSVSQIRVHRHGDLKALPGCFLRDYVGNGKYMGVFILDDPLTKGQTYDVSARWNPGPDELGDGVPIPSVDLNYSWSFYFDPDAVVKKKKKPTCRGLALRTIKSVAPSRRGHLRHPHLGIEEKVTLKQQAKVHLRRARLSYWIAGDRHSIALKLGKLGRKFQKVKTTSYLRFRLPGSILKHVIPGEPAELRLAFVGRRTKGCTKLIHVSRLRKVEIGWISMHGPASWTSAGKHHRSALMRDRA